MNKTNQIGKCDRRIYKSQSIDLSGRSIEIIVGLEDPVIFSVHENLICASSDFFKKAMSGNWKESRSRSVNLECDDPDVFQVYLHWLYRQSLPVRIDEPGLNGNAEFLQLARAYVLGDMLQDGHFQDAVLDAIISKTKTKAIDGNRWNPVGPVIRVIYDNTVESSKARRFLVDIYAQKGRGDWLTEWAAEEDLPKRFLLDLAVALLDKRDPPTEGTMEADLADFCEYHQHPPDRSLCYTSHLRLDRWSL